MKDGLRHRHPEASEAQILDLLRRQLARLNSGDNLDGRMCFGDRGRVREGPSSLCGRPGRRARSDRRRRTALGRCDPGPRGACRDHRAQPLRGAVVCGVGPDRSGFGSPLGPVRRGTRRAGQSSSPSARDRRHQHARHVGRQRGRARILAAGLPCQTGRQAGRPVPRRAVHGSHGARTVRPDAGPARLRRHRAARGSDRAFRAGHARAGLRPPHRRTNWRGTKAGRSANCSTSSAWPSTRPTPIPCFASPM